jgi:protein TonB
MNRRTPVFAPLSTAWAQGRVAGWAVFLALSVAAPAQAQTADQIKADFARAVYLNSATQVHNEQPQPLLRAVVVLRIRLNEQDQWQAEVFRDNPDQPAMTRLALDSVARLPAPVGLSPKARQMLRQDGMIEAWLFQNDGRFALKTLAKPQRSA